MAYQALGAIPVVVDLAELVVALSQHTIDSIDQPIGAFTSQQYYNVCSHVALTHHGYSVQALLGSKRKIDALPQALQNVLRDESKGIVPSWRTTINSETTAAFEVLKQSGVAFTNPDHAAFRRAVDPVYAMMQSKLGGTLLDRITRTANR